jgi:hypothetical protein
VARLFPHQDPFCSQEVKSARWEQPLSLRGSGRLSCDRGFSPPRDVAQSLRSFTDAPLPRSRAGVRHALRYPAFPSSLQTHYSSTSPGEYWVHPRSPFHATLFDKSPEGNWLGVCHQDTALPLRERRETPGWGPWSFQDGTLYAHARAEALTKVVALRVHLDQSSGDNGPLRVLPATHGLGALTDAQIAELVTNSTTMTCTVPVGSILAMRPLLVHSSSKSHTDLPRRVLHIEYAT